MGPPPLAPTERQHADREDDSMPGKCIYCPTLDFKKGDAVVIFRGVWMRQLNHLPWCRLSINPPRHARIHGFGERETDIVGMPE